MLVAAFLVAGLLTSSAVSRRVREFGTLKALGWKSGRVTRQVVGEAIVNGLVGGALGIALGLAGAYVVTAISPTLQAEQFGGGGGGGGRRRPGAAAGGGFGGPAADGVQGPRRRADRTRQPQHDRPRGRPGRRRRLIAGAFGGWRASRLRPADALRRVE